MNGIILVLLMQVRVVTLDVATKEAEAHQPQLEAARAQLDASEARVDEARALLLPAVNGSASYSRATGNPHISQITGSGSGMITGTGSDNFTSNDIFNAGVSGNILIWDFHQTSGKRDAARYNADAQAQSEKLTEQTVMFSVREAYFTARAGKDLVNVATDNLANLQKHLDQIQAFVRVGTRPEIDLAQARTDLANGRVALITAQNNYGNAKAQLIQAMGTDEDADTIDVGDDTLPAVDGEDGALATLVDEGVKARPDIAALDAQIRAQQATSDATSKALLPSLRANAGATEGGVGFDNLAWNLSIGLTLSWPIYDGGGTPARTREADATLAQFRAERDQLRQQVRLDVDQARRQVKSAKTTVDASEEALFNAKEQLRLAEGRYQNGVGNAIELGDAQIALTTAAGQKVQAQYNVSSARAQLLKALGR